MTYSLPQALSLHASLSLQFSSLNKGAGGFHLVSKYTLSIAEITTNSHLPHPPPPSVSCRENRGAVQSDLDRLRRRMASKTERIKTLRALADECWAEGEPSVGRDTLDSLEASVFCVVDELSCFGQKHTR